MAADDSRWVELRYEQKLVAPGDAAGVLARVLCDRAFLVEEHPPRDVHTVYLDTASLALLRSGFDGLSARRKIRLRWYGDRGARGGAMRLEVKERLAGASRKEVVDVGERTLAELLDDDTRRSLLAPFDPLLGLPPQSLTPTLYGCYRRRYLAARDGGFRVTVDDALQFQRPRAQVAFGVYTRGTIVEVKHGAAQHDDARDFIARLPWRLVRHSKYARGMQRLGG